MKSLVEGIFQKSTLWFYLQSRLLLVFFLWSMLSTVCLISSVVNSLLSFVFIGSSINVLIRLWYSISSASLSLGIRCSSVHCIVLRNSSVWDTLVFWKIDFICLLLVFPAADLFTMFHGFLEDNLLQYCFHDCILALFIFAWYWAFSA